eukprot:3173172-Amphidinium_carterae.1
MFETRHPTLAQDDSWTATLRRYFHFGAPQQATLCGRTAAALKLYRLTQQHRRAWRTGAVERGC